MHSPPLSATAEDEVSEMNSATAPTASTTPSGTLKAEQSFGSDRTLQHQISIGGSPVKQETAKQSFPAAAVQGSRENHAWRQPGLPPFALDPVEPSGQAMNQQSLDLTQLGKPIATSSRQLEFASRDSKELAIQRVLEHGKVLKVSRRLRTRLEYAILKIRRGWSKYTLHEVESLMQPVCSPRITARHLKHSVSSPSPRQSEKKRTKKLHPFYEEASYSRSSSHPPTSTARDPQDEDHDIAHHPSAPPTPTGRYRSRMPSLSQYKDSELFQPAKSLMDIATSKPEPGYLTPEPFYRTMTPTADAYNRWSAPASPSQNSVDPLDDVQDEDVVPSEAQAARTILMLSSPTVPAARTFTEMHTASPSHSPLGEWTAPYSPMTSSPLVHFQTAASTTPSADYSPLAQDQAAMHDGYSEDDRGSSHARDMPYSVGRTFKPNYASLYGMGHEPSSPSPLSSSLFPPSHDSLDRLKTHSRSSSPTLKRAVRFAAAATRDSESKLNAQQMKDKQSGRTGQTGYNSHMEAVYSGSQPAYDDRKEYSPSPFVSSSSSMAPGYPENGEGPYAAVYEGRQISNRASTPTRMATYRAITDDANARMAPHGMRTPPPSGGKVVDVGHYAIGASAPLPMRRRNSGVVPLGDTTDLAAMYRSTTGAAYTSASPVYPPHPSSSSSSSSH
ncbi:hypothetical protein BGZ70_009642 [Mortierella alpina]|uniref:Uncharacterized protein n=1 Tax=Mortierella alpina TaxID=64518 RepID=A0A9P6JF50_MORAP|nr:hypothetical protein BGZ70_009642 [Mortierella alpina]